jgi:hypothetical protein
MKSVNSYDRPLFAKASGVTIRHDTGVVEKVNCSGPPTDPWASIKLAPGDLVRVPKKAGYNLPPNKPHAANSRPGSPWRFGSLCRAAVADAGRSALMQSHERDP